MLTEIFDIILTGKSLGMEPSPSMARKLYNRGLTYITGGNGATLGTKGGAGGGGRLAVYTQSDMNVQGLFLILSTHLLTIHVNTSFFATWPNRKPC
jgi:hypothetical protein